MDLHELRYCERTSCQPALRARPDDSTAQPSWRTHRIAAIPPRGQCRCTAFGREVLVTTYWPLLGVAVVIAGFVTKRNPVLVVVIAGLVSGLAAGKSPGELLELLGTAFVDNR